MDRKLLCLLWNVLPYLVQELILIPNQTNMRIRHKHMNFHYFLCPDLSILLSSQVGAMYVNEGYAGGAIPDL